MKRGADAPLKRPSETNSKQRVPEEGLISLLNTPARLTQSKESQREAKPLLYIHFPLPLIKGKGDKGGWGYQIKQPKAVRSINNFFSAG